MAFPVKFAGEDYDLKKFMRDHPGGVNTLKKYKGKSITHAMKLYDHSNSAYHMLSDFKIKNNDNNLTGSVSENGRIITREEVEWDSEEIELLEKLEGSQEWERKKSYLIRSLFEDVPILSPIQEEHETGLSSFNDDFRADSPLPDLIIEKEPKKRYLHDEPEGFYKKLAKEMRRLYKRDYYSVSVSTDSLESLKSFEENEDRVKILADLSNSLTKSSTSLHELEIVNKGDVQHNEPEFEEKEGSCEIQSANLVEDCDSSSSDSRSSDSDSNIYSQQIEIQAEVYSYRDNELQEHLIHIEKYDKNSGVAFKTCTANLEISTRDSVLDTLESKEECEEEEHEELAGCCDASCSSVTESSQLPCQISPEIMRQVQRHASIESVPPHDKSNTDSDVNESIDIPPMEIEEAVISYGPKEAASPSYLNTFISTSTPKSSRLDWSKPLLSQLYKIAPHYEKWVNSAVYRKCRLFESSILESLTYTPWYLVPVFWVPAIIYLSVSQFTTHVLCGETCTDNSISSFQFLQHIVFGIIIWTLLEYSLHRWVFHYDPGSSLRLIQIHFLIHGLHHKFPFDDLRQVFPPVPAVAITCIIYVPVWCLFSYPLIKLTGGIIGYLIYDMIHYYVHHGSPKDGTYLYAMKRYHSNHHFLNHDKAFGISCKLWDHVFKTFVHVKKLGFGLHW